MVALMNQTLEQELVESEPLETDTATDWTDDLSLPAPRGAFVDEAELLETEDLPAGTRREQLIIQIRLMNPGATREMLTGFGESALQAYVDHLKLAMTPRSVTHGRGRGIRRCGVPCVVRYVVDRE